MSECNHDKRFHLMGATNGCCACHAEQLAERLAAAEALLRTASVSELVKRAVKEAANERQ
jgi:hypothetical protein